VETDITRKGGDQRGEQAELGSILVVFSETTHLVDDLEVFNNLYKKN